VFQRLDGWLCALSHTVTLTLEYFQIPNDHSVIYRLYCARQRPLYRTDPRKVRLSVECHCMTVCPLLVLVFLAQGLHRFCFPFSLAAVGSARPKLPRFNDS